MNVRSEWHQKLAQEDLTFIKRFVLASGSLKEMAKIYGVSYPTVRLRLDRLIEKIRVFDEYEEASPFEQLVRGLCADGKIDTHTLQALLKHHAEALAQSGGATP